MLSTSPLKEGWACAVTPWRWHPRVGFSSKATLIHEASKALGLIGEPKLASLLSAIAKDITSVNRAPISIGEEGLGYMCC